MLLHNLIIYASFVIRKYRRYRGERTVDRFSLNMIAQHLVLFLAFTILVITGFALKFPGVFQMIGAMGLDEHMRGIVHRSAATVLVTAGLYHLYWILFRRRGKIELRAMLPEPKDVLDAVAVMRYHLGLAAEKPALGRYSYIEKAEYWALVWGTVVMSLTGIVLWFPLAASNLLGSWAVPVATAIHYFEAILATLAILVWHLFFTIFHPDEYPMSLVWLSGKVSEEELREHRPLWHGEIERRRETDEPAGDGEPEA